jgi:hypothetical protein
LFTDPPNGPGRRERGGEGLPNHLRIVALTYHLAADLLPYQSETRANLNNKLADERLAMSRVFIMEPAQGQNLK